jgi:hypothetical protein
VSISAAFKKDSRDLNGLESIVQELIDSPLDRRVIVAMVEVIRTTIDHRDGGTRTPTVKLLQIEPLAGDVAEQAQKLLAEAYTARTGMSHEPTLFDYQPDDPDPREE